ncbi:UPF0202 family protein, putative [Eimeria brunetti]|uniref:UPF0202 family protein, putative n=1 Tax=Eimeria brunetti TaxID=51314 RepID=U6LN10_9EIME|nr:UPF0202 family protein, putative [Eimeria brunetti]
MQVDRGYFVKQDPYLDSPQPIGFSATISAPHMHAIALDQLADKLNRGSRALDVGSGTGYLTVCMALMVGAAEEGGGIAIGMDYIQGLVDLSRKNVAAAFPQLLQSPNFELIKGDGWAGGPSWGAPYDAIHVGAAAAAVPAALLQQLAAGGKMVIPVECSRGRITLEGLRAWLTAAVFDLDPSVGVLCCIRVHCQRCLILDDELNILPINGGLALNPSAPEALQQEQQLQQLQQQQQQQLQQIQEKALLAPPLAALVKLCATPDQANAVIAFLDCLCSCSSFRSTLQQQEANQQQTAAAASTTEGAGKPAAAAAARGAAAAAYQTVALTAARGRGKSAALGLAVAAAVSLGVSSTFVCAPSAENVQTLFEFVQKGLLAMGLREQADFQVSVETVGSGRRGPQVGAPASGPFTLLVSSTVKGYGFQDLGFRVQCSGSLHGDCIIYGPYTVLLSSTVNGYEGTGRSLSLKLLADLRRGGRVSFGDKGDKQLRRQLKELSLSTPIRYSAGDEVEKWLNQLLCLDTPESPALDPQKGLPSVSSCSLYLVNRDALFSYHPASEGFLHCLQSLFVSSHYKNCPNDLQLLADAPAHLLFVFLKTVQDKQDTLPDIYCAIQVAIEGGLSRGAIREALGRGLRPAGDLLPWTLAQSFGDEDVGLLTGARIVRIAVHPSLQRMGFGSAALQQLIDFFEGKGLSLQEPPEFAAFARAKQQQQQQGKGKKEKKGRVSALDKDIEDFDAEAGATDEESEEETERETKEETDSETEETTAKAKKRKKEKRLAKKQAAASAEEAGAKESRAGLSLREITYEQLQQQQEQASAALPLLFPCSRSRPPFSVDYMGVAFGLTEPLLRFWARKGFVAVYLRQQPNDVTGEHSCIMLRPTAAEAAAAAAAAGGAVGDGETAAGKEAAYRSRLYEGIDAEGEAAQRGAADPQWVSLFAADFRRRFIQLLGGPFRRLPVSLALATASGGPQDARGAPDGFLPPLDAKQAERGCPCIAIRDQREGGAVVIEAKVLNFFTFHDLGRLQQYAQQLADLPLIMDLIPQLCLLFFSQRLTPLHLSFLQAATLLGLGGQRKQPDELAEEFQVPVHQILALFNKAAVKLHQHLRGLLEAEEAANFTKASTRRVAIKQGEAVGEGGPQVPLGEEQQAAAAAVLQQQALQLKKIKEALGPDAVEKYGVTHYTKEEIVGATKGREVSGEIFSCLLLFLSLPSKCHLSPLLFASFFSLSIVESLSPVLAFAISVIAFVFVFFFVSFSCSVSP